MEDQPDSNQKVDLFLDLDSVIAAKNPRLLRILPRFVLSYLKKVIHQDDLNEIVLNNRHLDGIEFLDACIKGFGVKIRYHGLENVPADGRWIVASNHPLGGLDGIALIWVIGKIRKDIVFPVNDLLMNIPNLKDLFIPINKHGSNVGNVRVIEDSFASDKAMLYFPAGLCSRKQKDGICDLEWKKSFITKARTYKRDIIPCYISGRNSNWFYNLARFRAFLKIKSNIEMLYLVDEMFKQHDKEIVITFGKPISYTIFDKKKTDVSWAQILKNHVYSLGKNKNSSFIAE
ncbi:MAG: 1-acyl-sn-glycerol-3-phosphate acyltransferase [Lentimicrobiaceae bacterium]|jgi:putative hemolysin